MKKSKIIKRLKQENEELRNHLENYNGLKMVMADAVAISSTENRQIKSAIENLTFRIDIMFKMLNPEVEKKSIYPL